MKKILFCLFTGICMITAAAEPLNFNIVSLSATARKNVERDLMEVILSVEERNSSRETAGNRVTERSNRVLQAARADKHLQSALTARHAYPDYAKSSQKPMWHEEAQISVSSRDFEALSRFIAAVQKDAAVQSLDFKVSLTAKQKLQDQLTAEAVTEFRRKAQHITRALGAQNYRIVQLNIGNASDNNFVQNIYQARSDIEERAAVMKSAAIIGDTEAGHQDIFLNVSGSIQVQ